MKIKIVVLTVIVLTDFSCIYYLYLGSDAHIGYENIKNVYNIRENMDSAMVVNIMGKPILTWQSKSEQIFVYDTAPLYSETIQIKFDSTGRVNKFGPLYDE